MPQTVSGSIRMQCLTYATMLHMLRATSVVLWPTLTALADVEIVVSIIATTHAVDEFDFALNAA